jgi:hypothetical protein
MDKIAELKTVVGKECSCNYSPTHRSKLIKVGRELCILEVAPAQHGDLDREKSSVGVQFLQSVHITHNQFFF